MEFYRSTGNRKNYDGSCSGRNAACGSPPHSLSAVQRRGGRGCHGQCWYVPMSGGFHLVLVDEADKMSNAAQLHFLSKLDATAFPPQTIFVFTCNTTEGLEARFLSRTRQIEFSSYGMAAEATRLLEGIWQRETNGASAPNFARIVKESSNNIRDALMCLEIELLSI